MKNLSGKKTEVHLVYGSALTQKQFTSLISRGHLEIAKRDALRYGTILAHADSEVTEGPLMGCWRITLVSHHSLTITITSHNGVCKGLSVA